MEVKTKKASNNKLTSPVDQTGKASNGTISPLNERNSKLRRSLYDYWGIPTRKDLPMSNQTSQEWEPWGDNFIPVIPVDEAIHTPKHPLCDHPTCPCKDDPDNIEMVNQAYQDGLITANHATDIITGRKPW
jgi:hypothetical protein